jgi:[ribosomal protein S5]-alanine N-acetyltransferase
MTFSLIQLSKTELEVLAASLVPAGVEKRMEPDSMPPAFIASRALELAAAGYPLPWATTFLIVDDEDTRIVGACGFKTGPAQGRVEVGYGVAPSAQGRGAASKALQLLVYSAFEAGATEVLAEVAPTNHASTRVVQKAGFERVGSRVDNENEYVVQWVKRSEA